MRRTAELEVMLVAKRPWHKSRGSVEDIAGATLAGADGTCKRDWVNIGTVRQAAAPKRFRSMGSRPISPFIEGRIFGLAYKAVVSPSCLRCSRMALSGLSCSLHAREETQGGMGMADVAEFWRR